ncbi:MAG: hypothetical protein Roseis2KO_29750 [Roseivirga sp.]
MTRNRKIRGHRRRWKDIDNWVERNKHLDLEYLKGRERDYTKIWVHPWSGISITESETAQPIGATKKRMLKGLIEIYDAWKAQLETLNEPYYLKIWLFDPAFSRSQVVCAIGSALNFYEITFHKPEEQRNLNPQHYGKLADQIARFDWEYRWDELHFGPTDLGEPEDYISLADYEEQKRWFSRLMKKPLRDTSYQDDNGERVEAYAYRTGTVWIGGQ